MDILQTLSLSPSETPALPAGLRSRLVNFLIRWEHYDAALACLDVLQRDRPDLVSLYDARVRALLALDRADEALQAIVARHERKQSFSSRTQLARIYLACDQSDTALDLAKELVAERPDSVMGWGLLGDVHLALGDLDAAEGAYRRIDDVRPNSRYHAYSLARLYRAQKDYVSASAWAVRLESYADAEAPLSVYQLRWLRDYYAESGEANRVAEVNAQLEQRYQAELTELQETLFDILGVGEEPKGPKEPKGTKAPEEPDEEIIPGSSGPSAPSTPSVDVTAEELEQLQNAAKRHFGFDDLLPGQAEAMALLLRGESTLAVMPTGGGKSLCYQLPALLTEGTTFVVSPLIALMKDQVDGLPQKMRRHATMINSTVSGDELRRRLHHAGQGRYRLIYAAPERLRQPPFLHALRRAGIDRFVIDEAHCVSMWGHDFRPDYLFLAEARSQLGDPPILAMTATAPTRVRRDVMRRLDDMELVATDIHRPNLRLEAITTPHRDAKLGHLIRLCQEIEGAGIVYALTRARCEELAATLRAQGISAEHYHAGIRDRAAAQDRFMQGQVRIVVATVAFGMGIDKPDIRFIIHFNLPRSLEAYYQEAGRAGRDGLPSRCILFYSPSDRAMLTRWARDDQLSVDFLRQVYSAVSRRLGGAEVGRIPVDDLMREVRTEDTQVRVALSLLEEVGVLRRHFDAPRTAIVTRRTTVADSTFARFCEAARLVQHQPVERDIIDVARTAGLDPTTIEFQMLDWQHRKWIEYRPAGRDMLIECLAPPADAGEQIEQLLDTYATVQEQRIDEIAAYAKTRRCRHGHISAYFGGRQIADCGACDNCLGARTPGIPRRDGSQRAELEVVLRCVDGLGWSYGRRKLTAILKGSGEAPVGPDGLPQHGALIHRSTTAIGHLIERLIQAGFLQTRTLDGGGEVVEMSSAGRAALGDPQKLDGLVSAPPAADGRPEKSQQASASVDVDDEYDEDLFQKLRAWRLEVAKEAGVAPFIVAHNAVLKRIAARKPQTRDELAAIHGIGPKKLAGYGAAILEVVRDYLAERERGTL